MIAPIEAIIASARRRRSRGFGLLASLLGCAILSGCGGFQYVGTWQGKRDLKAPAGSDPSIYVTINVVELVIKDDGTFTLRDKGIPKSGKVRYGSQSSTLEVTQVFESPLALQPKSVQERNKEIALEPQKDGTLRLLDPGDFGPQPVFLKRAAKP